MTCFRAPHPAISSFVVAALACVALWSSGPAVDASTGELQRVNPPQIVLGSQVPPEFPPAAKAGRFSGAVTMQVTISPEGTIAKVEILDCTHKKLGFEEASVAAVEQWRFEPATAEDGTPVEASIRFRMSFNRARPGSPDTVSVSPFAAGGSSEDDGKTIERIRSRAPSRPAAASKPN